MLKALKKACTNGLDVCFLGDQCEVRLDFHELLISIANPEAAVKFFISPSRDRSFRIVHQLSCIVS